MSKDPRSKDKRQDALIALAIARAIGSSIVANGPVFGAPGATIAPGAVVSPPRALATTLWVNVTGAQVRVNSPGPNPLDGDLLIIKPVGLTFVNPILLVGSGGAIWENRTTPSVFVPSTLLTTEGGAMIYQFQFAGARWGIVGLLGNN